MKAWEPAELIAEVVWPVGSVPEREIIPLRRYRWRWMAELARNMNPWFKDGHMLVFLKVR